MPIANIASPKNPEPPEGSDAYSDLLASLQAAQAQADSHRMTAAARHLQDAQRIASNLYEAIANLQRDLSYSYWPSYDRFSPLATMDIPHDCAVLRALVARFQPR